MSRIGQKIIEIPDNVEANIAQDEIILVGPKGCLLYTSPSPRDRTRSRMPSSA